MKRDPRAGGGEQHQGVGAPRVIAARTSEDALPLPGDPHLTTSPNLPAVTDPLWPLVAVLGDIANRISRNTGDELKAPATGPD